MSSKSSRSPPVALLARIDELIRFYELYKPEAGKRIDVAVQPELLAKALHYPAPLDAQGKPVVPREFDYRGRTLVAVGARS